MEVDFSESGSEYFLKTSTSWLSMHHKESCSSFNSIFTATRLSSENNRRSTNTELSFNVTEPASGEEVGWQVKMYRSMHRKKVGVYEVFIIALIMASLALGILNTIEVYQEEWVHTTRIALESLLLLIFVIEYVLRIWSSGAHGTYGAHGGWKKYLLTPHMVIDILVIISSFALVISLQVHVSQQSSRFLHLFQLLRILRIDRQRGAFLAFWKVFKRHRKELLTCWYMGFLMVVFVSFLVYALERKKEKEDDNLFDGVYWGVISLTTIGYGDLTPETTSGKILICCFAIFGTCFLAMPAGIIGSGFALQVAEQQKEKHVNRRRRPAAILIQSYWRKYAADNDKPATWLPHIKGREEKYQKSKNENEILHSTLFVPAPRMSLRVKFDERRSKSIQDVPTEINNENGMIKGESGANGDALWYPRKTLTKAEKSALRFVRYLKCISSTKNFKQARRPYDERDILDQFAASQVEMFAKLRELRVRMDGRTRRESSMNETYGKLTILENQVCKLQHQLDENNTLLKMLLLQIQKKDEEECI